VIQSITLKNSIMKIITHLFVFLFCIVRLEAQEINGEFFIAVKEEDSETFETLLENGADPNLRDESGKGCLHYFAESGNIDLLNLALERHADPNMKTKKGLTPIMLAVQNNYPECCESLLKTGADITIHGDNGKTALDYATDFNLFYYLEYPEEGYGNVDEYVTWEESAELFTEYFEAGNFEKALEFGKKEKAMAEFLYGRRSYTYIVSCIDLAMVYQSMEDYKTAEQLYIEAKELDQKKLFSLEYFAICQNLASLYSDMQHYDQAETLYLEVRDAYKRRLGKRGIDYAIICIELGILYQNQGRFSQAETMYLDAHDIYLKHEETRINEYPESCDYLGFLYLDMGQYKKAEEFLLKEKSILEDTISTKFSEYIDCQNNLAKLYGKTGNYEKSEALYYENLKLIADSSGKQSLEYALALIELGDIYHLMTGDYEKAEYMYSEGKRILEKISGRSNSNYASVCLEMAILYSYIGNYDKAESFCNEAKSVYELIYGINGQDYANSCLTLSLIYSNRDGDFEKAEALIIEAKDIFEHISGKNSQDYALSCNHLAGIYRDKGDLVNAEKYYLESRQIYENLDYKTNIYYTSVCNNLSELYRQTQNYERALQLINEAQTISKPILGEYHPFYIKTMERKALIYKEMGDIEKAGSLFVETNQKLDKKVIQSGMYMSEKERENFLKYMIEPYYNTLYSFYFDHYSQENDYAGISFNNALLMKGLLLRSRIAMQEAVQTSKDSDLIKLYNDWLDNGRLLEKLLSEPFNERILNTDSLEDVVNGMEKQLFSSKAFKNFQSFNDLTWRSVQKALKDDEVAVEFVNYNYFKNVLTDSIFYYALIISPNMKQPEPVFLFEEKQLDSLISAAGLAGDDYRYVQMLYDKSSVLSGKLYTLIWKPLEPYMKGKKKIFISPTGLLHKVSFKAVLCPDGSMLSDQYELIRLSSTSKINTVTYFNMNEVENIVLYGGIEYSPDTVLWKTNVAEFHKKENFGNTRSLELQTLLQQLAGNSAPFSYLEGSESEIKGIANVFKDYAGKLKTYSGENATEEVFKSNRYDSPAIIHIATHGFYFPDDTGKNDDSFIDITNPAHTTASNPLNRCGLAFAGANWGAKGTFEDREDGILTAYEISQTPLFNVKLVVLSACQTGLGDVKGAEGVYGLQRALKCSGVEYMIISLWSVPDEQTRNMMLKIYENLNAGMDINAAFNNAQNDLKEEFRTVKGGAFAWAAFVLIR
jgi:CHAT domain-containing protein/tetratricopeptide (TPR) repeat protein